MLLSGLRTLVGGLRSCSKFAECLRGALFGDPVPMTPSLGFDITRTSGHWVVELGLAASGIRSEPLGNGHARWGRALLYGGGAWRWLWERWQLTFDTGLGLILCSEKNEAVAKYSVLNESRHLFASKYLPYLPTEADLARELTKERLLIEARLTSTLATDNQGNPSPP